MHEAPEPITVGFLLRPMAPAGRAPTDEVRTDKRDRNRDGRSVGRRLRHGRDGGPRPSRTECACRPNTHVALASPCRGAVRMLAPERGRSAGRQVAGPSPRGPQRPIEGTSPSGFGPDRGRWFDRPSPRPIARAPAITTRGRPGAMFSGGRGRTSRGRIVSSPCRRSSRCRPFLLTPPATTASTPKCLTREKKSAGDVAERLEAAVCQTDQAPGTLLP